MDAAVDRAGFSRHTVADSPNCWPGTLPPTAVREIEIPSPQVVGKRAEAMSPETLTARSHLCLPAYLDGMARPTRILWPIPTLPNRPVAWCLLARPGGRLVLLFRGCGYPEGPAGFWAGTASAAGAGTPSPPCMPMRRTWGPLNPSRERATLPARSHRRWPADAVELDCLALPRCRDRGLTLMPLAGLRIRVTPVQRGRWKERRLPSGILLSRARHGRLSALSE
jgi:hypothetical protein